MPDAVDLDPLAGLLEGVDDVVPARLAGAVREIRLVDHHVHGAWTADVDRATVEAGLVEASTDPVPTWMSAFDTPLGFAVRRWCAPLLGLPPHAGADAYWEARSAVPAAELARRFTAAAGVGRWVVDTGFAGGDVQAPEELAVCSGSPASEVVRLEALAEAVLAEEPPAGFADAFRRRLATAATTTHARTDAPTGAPMTDPGTPGVVGAKSVAAYRCGFDVDWSRPSDADVARAAATVVATARRSGRALRLVDPVLIAFGVHEAADLGLPVQLHVGLGDRDLDLRAADPLLLTPLLRTLATPVLLLHCWPFHRQAAYLASAFDHVSFDVGLAVAHLGSRSVELVGEALELAPFAKQLYSSDAFGPPELHLLGSLLWRRAAAITLGAWVRRGECSEADAVRVVEMVGAGNARRVYGLP